MENKSLDKIIEFARNELMKTCGYCSVANTGVHAVLNSADVDGSNIKIIITLTKNDF